ncbi:uncharacterized protein DUF3152 [Actinophytocola oryzae]|uniref:Uncharacterized protein DUF3152 n=1 Tax=Actinophytocola oryzae TaxID=502181 RepID=A0A4R7UR98_9PSEU|nr:uncharacterized protein DUF3152 [Actinophytocola oryzae]
MSAEPLAAKWHPTDEPPSVRRKAARKKGVLATYGWRLYAVPLLLAVTAVAVFQTVNDDNKGEAATGDEVATGSQQDSGDVYAAGPEITEKPAKPNDPNIPTAELPPGPNFLQTGNGKFTVLPGTTDRVGTAGRLYTYTIEVEEGIDLAPYGGIDSFGRLVDSTLADPRGWVGTGQVSVQRVDGNANPDIRFTLGTPDTLHRADYCGYSIKYESSCWRRSEKRVMINLARWVRGALAFGGDIGSYREYAINHEIGHAFGKGHVGCTEEGGLAPVMMQQSFGTANNYVAQLNDQAGNDDPVQADGKTCRFNQWPNPQAQPPT